MSWKVSAFLYLICNINFYSIIMILLLLLLIATGTRTVDSKEFRSEQFQRVSEYLRRHTSNMSVDRFTYIHDPESIAEDPVESLQLYLKYVKL